MPLSIAEGIVQRYSTFGLIGCILLTCFHLGRSYEYIALLTMYSTYNQYTFDEVKLEIDVLLVSCDMAG